MTDHRRRVARGCGRIALRALALLGALLLVGAPAGAEQSSSQGRSLQAGQLALGTLHTCAILDSGQVRCWGSGGSGRLGHGATATVGDDETPGSVGPVDLGAGRTAVAIGAGGAHACAILDSGQVRCWGRGASGQLGYGNSTDIGDDETPGSVGPVGLGAGRTSVAIGAGANQTCALLDTGQVRCWGDGADGRLGYASTSDIGDDETSAAVGTVDIGGSVLSRVAALSLAGQISAPGAQVGDMLTITTVLANAGPDPAAVTVDASPAAGLEVVSATPGQGVYAASSGTWSTGPLAVGAQATLQVQVRVIAPGTLTSTARIVASSARDPLAASDNLFPTADAQAQVSVTVPVPAPQVVQVPGPTVTVPGPTVEVPAPVVRVRADRLGLVVATRTVRPGATLRVAGILVISRTAPRTACRGAVLVQVRAGTRVVARRTVSPRYLRDACRLSASLRIPPAARLGTAATLRVSARFAGNPRLLALTARPVTVRVRR